MDFSTNLRTVIVVGAAGGIGLEIVRQLQSKVRVLAVVQNQEQVGAAASAGAGHCLICDIADASQVDTCVAELRAQLDEGLSGLIVCAAVQPVGVLEATRRVDMERLFAINVFGGFQLTQGLLPALRQSRGRIVLFSSMAGKVASPMLGAYTASKFALEGLADTLRRELMGIGVSVSLIEPGGVNTPMAASQAPQVERALQGLSAELRGLYEPLHRGYLAMAIKALRFASTPSAVAKVAVDAVLCRKTPAARYVVGPDAKLLITLCQLLPARITDAVLARAISAR
jgi:NAD(P)-dependent dehydrogenase (short-subunit alcohol dehydrogenase family)